MELQFIRFQNFKILVFLLFFALPKESYAVAIIQGSAASVAACVGKVIPEEDLIKQAELRAPKLKDYGELLLKGKHKLVLGRVTNQEQEEICWGYSTAGLATQRYEILHPGSKVRVSPEFIGFNHVYAQIKNHIEYFKKAAAKLDAMNLSPKERELAIKKESFDTMDLMKRHPKHVNATLSWLPNQGNFESAAFYEAEHMGMVPSTVIGKVRKTPKDEELFENAIQRYVQENCFDTKKLKAFEGAAEDGINNSLHEGLSKKLKRYLGGIPPRPNEAFAYKGKTYTPRTWMHNYLGFKPKEWKAFAVSPKTHELSLEAVREALLNGDELPLGVTLFSDTIPGTQMDVQTLATKTGIFTAKYCPDGKCTHSEGGHEIRIVNAFVKDGKITAFVIQNSWGYMGRAADGTVTHIQEDRGFYIMETEYLRQSFGVYSDWDFAIPDEVATQPKFKKLEKERG